MPIEKKFITGEVRLKWRQFHRMSSIRAPPLNFRQVKKVEKGDTGKLGGERYLLKATAC